jgi:1-acyl-sn-glycerol-3-phosphate acyltransferase
VNPVYATAIAASLTSFAAFRWDVRVTGAEHVPELGPAVIATNHVGYLDFVFAGYGARRRGKRRVRFVAKREVFDHTLTGPLMRSMGHIAVDRSGDTRVALREVAGALEQGDLVGMFPEGTISPSFVPLSGRPGAARMAMDAGAPLVPGALWGTQRIFTKGRSFRPAPGTVVLISFGAPIAYEPDEDATAVHRRLMASIGEQVDDLQRRYPQRPNGPDDTWWQPAHLGGSAPTPEAAEARVAEERAQRRRDLAARREQRRGDR